MSLLVKYKKWRFDRYAKTIGSNKSTLEGRLTAMDVLFIEAEDKKNDEAWLALMKRWDISVEHTIHDENEKDEIRDRLINSGPHALDLIKKFCKKEKRINKWASEVLFHFVSEEDGVEFITSLLEFNDIYISTQQAEKDLELLQMLRSKKGSAAVKTAINYLKSPDHTHRYAAIEILEFQAKNEEIKEPLLELYKIEESGRLKTKILEVFAKRGITIENI